MQRTTKGTEYGDVIVLNSKQLEDKVREKWADISKIIND